MFGVTGQRSGVRSQESGVSGEVGLLGWADAIAFGTSEADRQMYRSHRAEVGRGWLVRSGRSGRVGQMPIASPLSHKLEPGATIGCRHGESSHDAVEEILAGRVTGSDQRSGARGRVSCVAGLSRSGQMRSALQQRNAIAG